MKQNKPQLLLKHYLKKLKLPTMLRDYEAVAVTCAHDNGDYVNFLLRLVEREALDREKVLKRIRELVHERWSE